MPIAENFNQIDLQAEKPSKKPYVSRIEVQHIAESNPDLSFLEQDYHGSGCTDEEADRYRAEDQKRLDNYGQTWESIGIKAIAEIVIPMDTTPASGIIQRITSGGLWGIASDSGKDYLAETDTEQTQELIAILGRLGIDTPDTVLQTITVVDKVEGY